MPCLFIIDVFVELLENGFERPRCDDIAVLYEKSSWLRGFCCTWKIGRLEKGKNFHDSLAVKLSSVSFHLFILNSFVFQDLVILVNAID